MNQLYAGLSPTSHIDPDEISGDGGCAPEYAVAEELTMPPTGPENGAHTGHCFCGQVRYTIHAEPITARVCWCRDCQYISSGSPTVNVLFPEEAVRFEGEITRMEKIADSGNRVERGFCPACGSQMFSRTVEPAGAPIRIRAGTLDNRELMAPQGSIWTASAPSWAVLDPKLPQHGQGTDSPLIAPRD